MSEPEFPEARPAAASRPLAARSAPAGASARECAVLHVVRGAQRADELGHVAEALSVKIPGDPRVDRLADHRVVEQRGADAYRGGAGDDELQRIVSGGDAALPDDGDTVGARHLVHLMHL